MMSIFELLDFMFFFKYCWAHCAEGTCDLKLLVHLLDVGFVNRIGIVAATNQPRQSQK